MEGEREREVSSRVNGTDIVHTHCSFTKYMIRPYTHRLGTFDL